jgi:TorA maturation chaperone TorD
VRASLWRLARIRRDGYGLLAAALLYPDDARLARLAAAARRWLRDRPELSGLALHRPWTALLRTLAATRPQEGPALRRAFTEACASPRDGACSLYESQYVPGSPQITPVLIAALEREYAEAGLAPSPALGEPADHLAVELEYMAVLADREASAWRRGLPADAAGALWRQQRFMRQHLGRWAPRAARRLIALDPVPFYRAVAEGLLAFVCHDRDLIDLLLAHAVGVGGAMPTTGAAG